MTEITAALVKQLRDKTSAGMMDCKKALSETAGDFEAAIDWLRKKGLSAASKKADRVAAEGLVAALVNGKKGSVLELNSETDFVSRNDKFQALAKNLVGVVNDFKGDLESFKNHKINSTHTVAEEISEHIAVIGENMNLRRFHSLEVTKGAVVSYVHNQVAEGLGKICVLVALESEAPADKLQQLGKQIAMHIAAARPEAMTTAEVDPKLVEREKAVFTEQALASGKPKEVVEKMIEGRIRKYYEEVVLMEQVFIMDGKTKVSAFIEEVAQQLNTPIKLVAYVRYGLGEGIEKPQE